MNYKMILTVIVLTVMLNTGDYFIKLATKTHNLLYLWATALFWVASIPGWYYTMREENLSLICMLFAVVSLITTTIIGIILFNEKLSNTEWVGFTLTLISMYLLSSKL